ncbi:hypothetical protein [Cytobacillus firmus]|uniref:hypothetical protein n=1 Tax=Cytobacillus firmus TaxID=1399 RepID=UPI003002F337
MTQDKRSLVNVKEVTVKGKTVEGIIGRSFFVYCLECQGEYDTHERTLEVVEQIHKKLENEEYGSTAYTMPDKQNPRIVCRTH